MTALITTVIYFLTLLNTSFSKYAFGGLSSHVTAKTLSQTLGSLQSHSQVVKMCTA